MESKLDWEVPERQNIVRLHRKLERYLQDIQFHLREERRRSDQYRVRLLKDNSHSKQFENRRIRRRVFKNKKFQKKKLKENEIIPKKISKFSARNLRTK